MKQLVVLVVTACGGGADRDACTRTIEIPSVRVWREDLNPDAARTAAIDRCVADRWSADVQRCMSHTDRVESCLTHEQNAALQAAFADVAPELAKPGRLAARVDQILCVPRSRMRRRAGGEVDRCTAPGRSRRGRRRARRARARVPRRDHFEVSWMSPAATSLPAPAPSNAGPTWASPSSSRAKNAVR